MEVYPSSFSFIATTVPSTIHGFYNIPTQQDMANLNGANCLITDSIRQVCSAFFHLSKNTLLGLFPLISNKFPQNSEKKVLKNF